jgi:AbrB family looped-hinge helix DNA binding protein
MSITIDRAGRLVIPKSIRDRFHLVPGSQLEIEADTEGIRLRPAGSGAASLRRERGLLIHSGGGQVADVDIAAFIRDQRERRASEMETSGKSDS